MNAVRSLALALALAGAPLVWYPSEALAAEVFADGSYVRVVPIAPIVADGTVVDVPVLALNADGTPMTGLTLKPSASAGSVGAWTEVGGGLYRIPFHATGITQPTEVTLTAKGKSPAKKSITLSAKLRLVPPLPEVQAKATPPELTLGREPEASLTIIGAGRAGLVTATSTGKVETVTAMPGGAYTARFVPPNVKPPQNAILTFADAADPLAQRGFTVVRLFGNVEYPVPAEAGATVLLEIGDRKFGPVPVGDDGKARVPIQVPPGVQTATKVVVKDGQETREPFDLRIPESRRIQLFPMPATLPGDAGLTVPVRVVVVKPDGSPDPDAKPVFTVTAGKIAPAEHLGDGVFEADWTLPSETGAAKVEVTLGSDLQKDAAEVALVLRRPASTALKVEPAQIGPGTSSVKVSAKVTDAAGAGLDGAGLRLDVENGRQTGEVWDMHNGDFEVTVEPQGDGPLRLRARVRTETSKNPVRGVVLAPSRASAPNDGAAEVDLLVAAVDAFGVPVAGAKVAVSLVEGGGKLEVREVTTGDDGTATVTYVTGRDPGIAAFEATSGGAVGTAAIVQLPEGLTAPAIPPTGSEREITWARAWAASSPALTVPRGASGGATAPVSAVVPGGVVTIEVVSEPAVAKPGTDVKLTLAALDANGNPMKDVPPTLTASAGTLSPPVTGADGRVTATLSVPANVTGPVEIVAKSGGYTETWRLPMEGLASAAVPASAPAPAAEDGSPWGAPPVSAATPPPAPEPASDASTDAAADAGTATAPPEAAPAPEPARAPRGPGDYRWLRARASGVGSTYRYEQAPSPTPGPLIPSRLAVGGPDGGSPAAPVGGEADVRVWLDEAGLPYLGAHGLFRAASYAIESSAFSGVAKDALLDVEVDVLGRYPFEVAGDRYWVGAKAGFRYNDFLIFTGCLEPGCVVKFEPVPVPGLGLGAEIGAEIGDLYLIGGYQLGLAQATQPYANGVDVNVGYGFLDNVFADLGFSVMTRTVILQGTDSGLERGSISDSQMMVKLGVGFAM